MRWEDERYVRLYVRDTVEWRMLPWQAKAVWPLILRKVDRAGLLELGKHGAKGLAAILEMPIEVVEPGLAGLLEDGCAIQRGTMLAIPNFMDAQEAPSSDAQRAREHRARTREQARDRVMTSRDAPLQPVTARDDVSRNVTLPSQNVTQRHERHDARHSDPCRAVPYIPDPEDPNHVHQGVNGVELKLLPTEPSVSKADLEAAYRAYPRKQGKTEGMNRLASQVRTRTHLAELTKAIGNFAEQMRVECRAEDKIKLFSSFTSEWRDWIDWQVKAPAPARASPIGQRPVGDFAPGLTTYTKDGVTRE